MLPALTPIECLKLNTLPYLAQALYAVSLRPRLDENGVTGSFWIDECWSMESPDGIPDRSEIQSMLDVLEDRGLIQQLPPDNPWAFKVFMPCALSGQCNE